MGWFPLGTRKQGSRPLLPLPPPPTEMGPDPKQARHTPPQECPRTLTVGRHMVIKVPPLAERGRTPNDEYVSQTSEYHEPMSGQVDSSTTLPPPP